MNVSAQIHVVENDFHTRFGFSIFSQTPANQLSELNKEVNSKDEFLGRIINACAVFDHLNKKEMDKYFKQKTQGTRKALELFLKLKGINEQIFIEDKIIIPMNIICLLRDYMAHGKNRNKEKAINYFDLSDPINDYSDSWSKVLTVYNSIFISIIDLLRIIDIDGISSEMLNEESELSLVRQFTADFSYEFEDQKLCALFREVMESSPIKDSDLASLFNIDVIEVRLKLRPFLGNFFFVKYTDVNETTISFNPYFYKYKKYIFAEMGRNQ